MASSPAAGAAGLSLATHGLITNAGTWTGAIQGAAGGALIGNQIGGPLGAAAGASFGFEIGALERLFGVKSLNQTAHDDIKSVYGIDIPTNSGTIKPSNRSSISRSRSSAEAFRWPCGRPA